MTTVKQISVFLENKKGRVAELTRVLADHHIDLIALSISDTTEFGILRCIVSDKMCIRDSGKVQAFSMGESITDQMALIHIEKANAEIPGLYAVINREFLAHSFAAKTFVNREEDMGDEGLRRAKQSYHPARMIEKFGARLV